MGWSGGESRPLATFSQQMAGGALTLTTGDGWGGGGEEGDDNAGGGSNRRAPSQRTRKGQPSGSDMAPAELPLQKPRKKRDPAKVRVGWVGLSPMDPCRHSTQIVMLCYCPALLAHYLACLIAKLWLPTL